MNRGGKTSTTWEGGSTWRSGKTKVIRIPEALEPQIMAYARMLDSENAVLHGNTADEREIILNAIANYTRLRAASRHNNQHSKSLDTAARTWDELRRFRGIVQNEPEKLGLKTE